MKLAHNIEMRVFSKEEDNEELIITKIHELFPFDFKKDKIELRIKISEGFEEKIIKIFTVFVDAQRHTNVMLKKLMENLNKEQKDLLKNQLQSRLDERLHFYIRLDKEKFLSDVYELTDAGNCFWLKICIAAYPNKKEIAQDIVKKILSL